MQKQTDMTWPDVIVVTIVAGTFTFIFGSGFIGIIGWIAGSLSSSPPTPKTIHCTQWREMESGVFMNGMRCEQWSDGKTLADVAK